VVVIVQGNFKYYGAARWGEDLLEDGDMPPSSWLWSGTEKTQHRLVDGHRMFNQLRTSLEDRHASKDRDDVEVWCLYAKE